MAMCDIENFAHAFDRNARQFLQGFNKHEGRETQQQQKVPAERGTIAKLGG